MRIAIAQLNTRAGAFPETLPRIVECSRRAVEQGAELLVLPLMTLTGPVLPDQTSREGFFLDMSESLMQLAEELACPCVASMVTMPDGLPIPESMLLRDGEVVPVRLLSSPDMRKAVPGMPMFEFGGMRLCVAFSYEDIDDLIDEGASMDALLFVSEYGFALDDPGSAMGAALGENRFRADADSLDAWVVGVSSLGGYGTQVHVGSSFVMTPWGELAASAPAFEEALLVADVLPDAEGALEEPLEPELYNRSLHLWEALRLGLHDYLRKQGKEDVALVLDGGLVSSVLATLASDAQGPTHVHAIVDPLADDARARTACELAAALRLGLEEVPAGLLADANALADDPLAMRDLAQLCLASLARAKGAVPLASVDKTYLALEVASSCCRAGALCPLGDVYRTDILELAHMRNTISPVLPPAALTTYDVPDIEGLDQAEPTCEARLRRVDVTLLTHIEWLRPLSDVIARQGEPAVTQAIVERMHDREAERETWPPYLVVSSQTLFDVHTPLGLGWKDRVRAQEERLTGEDVLARIAELVDREVGELPMPAVPDGGDESIARSVSEVMGLIQDILEEGRGQLPDGAGPAGPFGPLTWGSPFSEN